MIRDLASSYDFTYDTPYWYESDRQSLHLGNRMAMEVLRRMGIEYNVTLPVRAMSETHLSDLVDELVLINPHSIALLQLMPLGRNRRTFYDSRPMADKIVSKLTERGYTGHISRNCVLRGQCNGCSDEKLGLDHQGNLYWCIWAADLGLTKNANPFYLGNLLEEPLQEILARKRKSADMINRNYCHVLARKKFHLPN